MAEKSSGDGLLGWLVGGLLVGLVVLGLMVGAYAIGYDRGQDEGRVSASTLPPPTTTAPTSTEPTTTEPDLTAQGKELFTSSGCGGCHTLADAGASGTVGTNLDDAKPTQQLVVDRVTNGLGAMPSFEGQLSSEEIQAIATYVAQAAGG
jgi:mono/diheme cytochrome c family protein